MTHKTDKKVDLRVRRTEQLIFDALINCTIQKGFSEVTIGDITKNAGINRATFYRHYKDKFDLLNKYTQTVFNMLAVQDGSVNKSTKYMLPISLIKIFSHVQQNALFYRVMLGKNGDHSFAEKIRIHIQTRIQHSLPTHLMVDKKRVDLFVNYSSYASFGAVLWWLENNMPYSAEEMISMLQHLESENLKSLNA